LVIRLDIIRKMFYDIEKIDIVILKMRMERAHGLADLRVFKSVIDEAA